ncbi:DUF4174 domain-containing protein [Tateyamaria sp. SN6-1]|uniref:DUF4174 domain-containing protein n=1 Tax=Tateyamaria sp. SN6-1 TaxID=3092148 RepID=UPI0039F49CC8
MKRLLPFVFASIIGAGVSAETLDPLALVGTDVSDLEQFVWKNRPIVVFADSPNDPNFDQQMEFLADQVQALADRDVVVLTDTDPGAQGPLREKLRPRGFMLVLIGKDGGVKLRKPFPWDVRELSRTIDKMPIRQREIRDRRGVEDS